LCLGGTETGMHYGSVSGAGFGSGSRAGFGSRIDIKWDKKGEKIKNYSPDFILLLLKN
jgi:hypothetical protein